ncbi:MAG: cell division septal protein FtsQ [Pseudomonadota bacterium]
MRPLGPPPTLGHPGRAQPGFGPPRRMGPARPQMPALGPVGPRTAAPPPPAPAPAPEPAPLTAVLAAAARAAAQAAQSAAPPVAGSVAAAGARRDPAPSRWAYRMNRLWLTPAFRAAVRLGGPVALVLLVLGLWLGDADRRAALHGIYVDVREGFQNRPEFMVDFLAIEGASPVLAVSIRRALDLELPMSSFDIDLAAARIEVEAFDAVARAEVRIAPGGILQVDVTEREPAVVWRLPDGLWLLDAEGHRVARLSAREARADLPLIAGEGAERAVPEALMLLAAARPIGPRIRGLVRVGERRWNLVLDRDQTILLPAHDPLRALDHALALHRAQGLLERDIVAVDLRLPARITVRLAPGPDGAARIVALNDLPRSRT